jgi:hypothetical protein
MHLSLPHGITRVLTRSPISDGPPQPPQDSNRPHRPR